MSEYGCSCGMHNVNVSFDVTNVLHTTAHYLAMPVLAAQVLGVRYTLGPHNFGS